MKILNVPPWKETKQKNQFPTANGIIRTDVAIIGGGLVGVITAYLLAKLGKKVSVFESNNALGNGATSYTTAFLTKSIDTSLPELINLYGSKKAKQVWESGQNAIISYEDIIKKEKIDCNYNRSSFITFTKESDDYKSLQQEYGAAEKLGIPMILRKDGKSLGFPNSGFWEIKNQAKFNPVKFLDQLSVKASESGASFYLNSEITELKAGKKMTIKTKQATITADDIIVATYNPIKVLSTFAKKGMYTSYVFEVQIPKGLIKENMYVDTMNPYHYFRIDAGDSFDRMIIGGEDHRAELPMDPKKNFKALEEYLKTIVGTAQYIITRKWSGPILEPSDGLALIGEGKPHQYIATAFSGNGMTYSMIAASMFKDLLTGKKNPYTDLYSPTRTPSIKQFATKAKDYAEEFIGGAAKNIFK